MKLMLDFSQDKAFHVNKINLLKGNVLFRQLESAYTLSVRGSQRIIMETTLLQNKDFDSIELLVTSTFCILLLYIKMISK